MVCRVARCELIVRARVERSGGLYVVVGWRQESVDVMSRQFTHEEQVRLEVAIIHACIAGSCVVAPAKPVFSLGSLPA